MCGRFTLTTKDYFQLAEYLGVTPNQEHASHYKPRYNIAPTNVHWIVTYENEIKKLEPALWGLVPSWSKDEQGLINAKMETVETKPTFKKAFLNHRCVIPADGFYEWQGKKSPKQPYCFHLENREIFLFAGLYEDRFVSKLNRSMRTFTILTTGANQFVKPVHERMPVIITKKDADRWIKSPAPKTPEEISSLKEITLANTSLKADPVTTLVNNVRNDSPECIEPAG